MTGWEWSKSPTPTCDIRDIGYLSRTYPGAKAPSVMESASVAETETLRDDHSSAHHLNASECTMLEKAGRAQHDMGNSLSSPTARLTAKMNPVCFMAAFQTTLGHQMRRSVPTFYIDPEVLDRKSSRESEYFGTPYQMLSEEDDGKLPIQQGQKMRQRFKASLVSATLTLWIRC